VNCDTEKHLDKDFCDSVKLVLTDQIYLDDEEDNDQILELVLEASQVLDDPVALGDYHYA
jgi:hypothetical protein